MAASWTRSRVWLATLLAFAIANATSTATAYSDHTTASQPWRRPGFCGRMDCPEFTIKQKSPEFQLREYQPGNQY